MATSQLTNEDRALTTTQRKAIVSASIGNFVEWLDFGFYGYLSVTMAAVFFPSDDPITSLLATFLVFGAAFVVRPIGGIFFGPIGDRIGRKRVLAITVLGMSAATFLMALLPGYGTIGVLAPILLLILRLAQGFSAGGEPGGAATFLAEQSPMGRRGVFVSLWHVSSFIALICASAISMVLYTSLDQGQMESWGWRLPFLLALPIGMVGLYIRMRTEDSPDFKQLERDNEVAQSPLADVLRLNWPSILKAIFVNALQGFGFYFAFVYLATYMSVEAGYTSGQGALLTIIAVAAAAMTVTLFGRISDTIGRRPVMIASAVVAALFAIPLLLMLSGGNFAIAVLGAAIFAVIQAAFMGSVAPVYPELFPTKRRYSGMSFGYAIGSLVFSGTAPYLSTWVIGKTGSPIAPAFLLMAAALISLIAALTIPERSRMRMRDIE